jgi:hypothetical protein
MKAGLSQNWAIKSGEDDMNIDEPGFHIFRQSPNQIVAALAPPDPISRSPTTWKKASLIATGLRLRLVEAVSYSLTQQLQQCNGQDPPGNRATRKMMRQQSATLTNQNTDAQILKCLAIASSPNTMVIQC